MTWSYSGTPSEENPKDQVRFLTQDTVEDDQLLSDEEITFLLGLEGGPLKASVKAAETIAAKFARKCDEAVGQVKISFSQKFDQYIKLAKALKRHSDIKGAIPFSGGLDISQKDTQRDDDDRVEPFFRRELHDFRPRETDRSVGRVISEGVQEEEEDP